MVLGYFIFRFQKVVFSRLNFCPTPSKQELLMLGAEPLVINKLAAKPYNLEGSERIKVK